jgi:hypothetical protein
MPTSTACCFIKCCATIRSRSANAGQMAMAGGSGNSATCSVCHIAGRSCCPDATAFICEGEKDADRVASLNHCATTVAHGEWTNDCVQALAGRDVIVLQDNDAAGRKKALKAATVLHGVTKTVRIVSLPGLAEGEDVSDWLDLSRWNTIDKLIELCFSTPPWTPSPSTTAPAEPTPDPPPAGTEAADQRRLLGNSRRWGR